jgi:hypothetical protein
MMKKVTTVAVGAVAYLLGAKAGRERYDQIATQTSRLWRDPRVRQKASQAGDLVKDQAPRAGERLAGASKRAAAKVTAGGKNDGHLRTGHKGEGHQGAEHTGVKP